MQKATLNVETEVV